MRLIKILSSIHIIFFVFTSCQKNIEFNDEISKPMVVVHSFLSPDSVVSAHVSLSRFFLNDTIHFQDINNADVDVIVNGALKYKMSRISDGQYRGTFKPAIGDVVKLLVKVPNMNDVSSETSFEKPPVIISVDTTKINQSIYYTVLENKDTLSSESLFNIYYTLKFSDSGKEKNYYRLIVRRREHSYRFEWGEPVEKIYEAYYFNFTDVVSGNYTNNSPITGSITGENTDASSSNKYNVFSDELFNGKTYSLTFNTNYSLFKRYSKYSLDSEFKLNGGAAEKIEVFISLQSISKDYYYYLKSRSASGGDDFFSEPIQIKNNIVGGIGFLGSYTSSNVVQFDLK